MQEEKSWQGFDVGIGNSFFVCKKILSVKFYRILFLLLRHTEEKKNYRTHLRYSVAHVRIITGSSRKHSMRTDTKTAFYEGPGDHTRVSCTTSAPSSLCQYAPNFCVFNCHRRNIFKYKNFPIYGIYMYMYIHVQTHSSTKQ